MKTYHLTKTDKGWQIKAQGADRATYTAKTKDEVLNKFRAVTAVNATKSKPISLRIHGVDGKIKEERTYPRGADPKRSKG